MAYASFHDNNGNNENVRQREITEGGISQGKAIAKIYGYMGIGLLVTALVSFFGAWLFSSQINAWLEKGLADMNYAMANTWIIALFVAWGVSIIGVLILSFVIPIRAARSGKSLWFPYILYAFFVGVLLIAVLLTGIPFWMIGEAFGITTLAFVAMFAIGWTSKKDLSILAFIALILLFAALILGIIGVINLAFHNWTANQAFWWDMAINGIMVGVILLITIVDTWRIKQIIMRAGESENIYLYGAYVMYTDFITLLIRILLILARTQRR